MLKVYPLRTYPSWRNQLFNKRDWYLKNRERILQERKGYYKDNREAILARMKRNYDPAKKHAYNKPWFKQFSEGINKQINGIFGKECFLCGNVLIDSVKQRPNLHEIHGKKHPLLRKKGIEFLRQHKEDFKPLCSQCHTGVHFLMKFGYQWEEIEKLTKREIK